MFNLTIRFICLDSAKSFAWIKLTSFKTSEHNGYFFFLLKIVPEFKKTLLLWVTFSPQVGIGNSLKFASFLQWVSTP